jgi:hypothetical protein
LIGIMGQPLRMEYTGVISPMIEIRTYSCRLH